MSLKDQLERLSAFEPDAFPVVSLYLNSKPGPTGRDQFQTFVRKEMTARIRTYESGTAERESLERDRERIGRFLETGVDPSANGVALFACSAADHFDAIQTTAPIDQHWLYIGDRPHLYPLARVESLFPRYAALLAETSSARILVFASDGIMADEEVRGIKTKRTSQGGWSQARFQRHVENFHLRHAKEVVDALDRIVTRENINEVILAGDEVIIPLLREQMPKHLAEKIVDHLRFDRGAPMDAFIRTSLEAMKRVHGETEREKVEAAISAYRAGGLGTVGPEDTLDALIKGQVDELLVSASVRDLEPAAVRLRTRSSPIVQAVLGQPAVKPSAAGEAAAVATEAVRLADGLITKATQTAAKITFIEDPNLLASHEGVAALLRFRI
jgi:peptide chain release factor subunit 1